MNRSQEFEVCSDHVVKAKNNQKGPFVCLHRVLVRRGWSDLPLLLHANVNDASNSRPESGSFQTLFVEFPEYFHVIETFTAS
jgi:hypothetical protein